MAELTLKTRLLNKMSEDHVDGLLKGEINFYPINDSTNDVQYLVMEVGGTTLPFAAKASDVAAWAKAEVKPEYHANEIKDLNTFIAAEIKDTNTVYLIEELDGKIVIKTKDGTKENDPWQQVGEIDIITPTELTTILNEYVKSADLVGFLSDYVAKDTFNTFQETNTAAINKAEKAGTDAAAALEAYKTTNDAALAAVEAAVEAKGYATVTYVDGEIDRVEGIVSAAEKKALEDAKAYADGLISEANLDQYTTEKEVKDIVDNVIASAADSDTYDSLTKLVDYIDAHGGEAVDMATAIETLEGKVDVDKVSTAIATAKAEAATDAQNKADAALEAAKADATTKADNALTAAKEYANSLNHEDTTYTPGTGLKLDNTVFSIDTDLVFILDAND